MSISAEYAEEHKSSPAVLCCRAEEGIVLTNHNLEDPEIFDDLVDQGLLKLDGCLTIGEVLGGKLLKTSDSLTPLTKDLVELTAQAGEPAKEEEKKEEAVAVPQGKPQLGGSLKIHIGEGKGIDIQIPVGALGGVSGIPGVAAVASGGSASAPVEQEEVIVRSLVRKHFKITEVKRGPETKLEGTVLTIREGIEAEAVASQELVEKLELEIITPDKRDIIKYVDVSNAGNPNAYDRKPFSKKAIKLLWNSSGSNEYISAALILIYTGLRISELLDLKKEDVHLDERWFYVKESKTSAGIREVPIAEKIVPFFEFWISKKSDYLICTPDGRHFLYRNFYDSYWRPIMDALSLKYTPHCTRHTCISLLTEAGVDERIIQQIVGHKGQNVTQVVYTHIDLPNKLEAINKI